MYLPHIISIDDLNPEQITYILNLADRYAEQNLQPHFKTNDLDGCIVLNLFLENSTRTRLSFEMAAHRLGANIINMSADGSSLKKGETILDTLRTLGAMRPDCLVIRHNDNDIAKQAIEIMDCPVLNAGSGTDEHPTQALLDALTIRRTLGSFDDVSIAICGDVKHSRVAKSNMKLLSKMGATVKLVGPAELLPTNTGHDCFTNIKDGFRDVDIVMTLRIQKERLDDSLSISKADYFKKYGITAETMAFAKPNAFVMHPGPMNQGTEISSEMAEHPDRSLILQQVEMGVAIRMACLDLLTRSARKN